MSKPETYNDEIRRVLTADWVYRKTRKWPLIDKYADESRIFDNFPLIKPLLIKYSGKLAICGGAVANCFIQGWFNPGMMDVDLFFYNVTIVEANAILEDCVATLVSTASDCTYVRIERRHLITNVVVHRVQENGYTQINRVYQFVHRIYPSLDTILGGFDIPLCMFSLTFERGEFRIQGTPIADYCMRNRVLIIDTTRRSTSYEHRVLKYKERFDAKVIFPGLDMSHVKMELNKEIDARRLSFKLNKLDTLMCNLGLTFTSDFKNSMVKEVRDDYEYDSDDEFVDRVPKPPTVKFTNMQLNLQEKLGPLNKKSSDRPPGLIPAVLSKFSDYGDSKTHIDRIEDANGSMLRCNNLDGVMQVCQYNSMTPHGPAAKPAYKRALLDFRTMIGFPCVKYISIGGLDGFSTAAFRKLSTRKKICMFAEFFVDLSKHDDKMYFAEQIPEIEATLRQREKDNYAKVVQMLTGVKWITENPGRQWTSSNNPIFENPRDFYGEHYEPFTVGIPDEVETLLRLILREFGCPKDIRNLICQYVVKRNYM